jgi:hypothetical protein
VRLSFKQGNIHACLATGLHRSIQHLGCVRNWCDSGGAAAVLPAPSTVTWLCEYPW